MTAIKQYDFTAEEVAKLFAMQDQLNAYIHPEWKTQGFDWSLAIIDECMEIHGHLGWKWWKEGYQVGLTDANRKQVQFEVIDILHFVVSAEIEALKVQDFEYWAACFNEECRKKETLTSWLKYYMVQAADYNLDLSDWTELAHSVGLSKQQILETYTQKFVLNKFRQDHGYKDGSYQKFWNISSGVCDDQLKKEEDNFWLEFVTDLRKSAGKDITDENGLYADLEALYNSRLNQ